MSAAIALDMPPLASSPQKTPTAASAKPSWLKRIVAPIINVVYSGISAESLALAFTLGIVCGIVPLPMVTSVVGALFCWLLRANMIASTAINYVMTPFHIAMLVPWIRAGEWLFSIPEPVEFSLEPFSKSFFGAVSTYGGVLARAACAWLICMPFIAVPVYYLLLLILRPIVAGKKSAQRQ
jgi:uncharacterized protein (DUF2062 family)